ncbi:hypothetical protein LDENG_00179560 [Lucifuga dentata]|nr:hypothetical protein LDENG_00179560 [Lucifuga dentata]
MDIKTWMQANFLKLNIDKSEIFIIGPKSLSKTCPNFSLCFMAPLFLFPLTSVTLMSSLIKPSPSNAMSTILQKPPSSILKTLPVFAPPSPSQPLKHSFMPS